MNHVLTASTLFQISMEFQFLFAAFSIGIPIMILSAELIFHVTKNRDYSMMAGRWTNVQAILFSLKIITTVFLVVQLTLILPSFVEVIKEKVKYILLISFSAFLEALFLFIYVYSYNRVSSLLRLLTVLFMVIGAIYSSLLFITIQFFGELNLKSTGSTIELLTFFITPGNITGNIVSSFMAGAFVIASVAALKMIRERANIRVYNFHRKALMLSLMIGALSAFFISLKGLVGIVIYLFTLSLIGLIWKHIMDRKSYPKWMISFFVSLGPLAIISLQSPLSLSVINEQALNVQVILTGEPFINNYLFMLVSVVLIVHCIALILSLRYYFQLHSILDEIQSDNNI